VDEHDVLAAQFEAHRAKLRSVAYRMLGSLAEADDAVQESWFRLSGSDADRIENLGGWLTTVVARVCLDMLRSRKSRREDPLDVYVPDPIISREDGRAADPEQEALLADSVGLAMLVVLQMLTPAERLAFVLHDMFAVPFDEIATIVDRSPAAAKQLASRARRRVQGAPSVPVADPARHREVVDAFLSAARNGDFEALVAVLDPDVVLRADTGAAGAGMVASRVIRGAVEVASSALTFARFAPLARRALVNGSPGAVAIENGRPLSVVGFSVVDGRIVEIDILSDPERLSRLDVTIFDDE
jgi:RNA polymerase sigma-70 factor (ECF subfamily)